MFIPIEGEDCIFLENVIALVREGERTTVYYRDGRISVTGFRPVTLKRRCQELMRERGVFQSFPVQQEVNDS